MNLLRLSANARPIRSIQHNHALEHATLHVISEKGHRSALAGFSDPAGFTVIGEVDTELLLTAAQEALTRLQNGERSLAIHENCGTNFAAAGVLAGFAGWLGMLGTRDSLRSRLDRLPTVIMLVTLALIFAQPLGPMLQNGFTTRADVGNLSIKEIQRKKQGSVTLHRILTQQAFRQA